MITATGRKCRNCGVQYAPHHPNSRYCSENCSQSRWREYAIAKNRKIQASKERVEVCRQCGIAFTYPPGTGQRRFHCSDKCRETYKRARKAERIAQLPKCKSDWCDGKATRTQVGLCEGCYMRQWRTGSARPRVQHRGWHRTGSGYVICHCSKHPLANKHGVVAQHRQVLYDAIGDGPHSCVWCGITIGWSEIAVDHLNDIKDDNRVENLAVSCNGCNRARGAMKPFIAKLSPASLELLTSTFPAMAEAVRRSNA